MTPTVETRTVAPVAASVAAPVAAPVEHLVAPPHSSEAHHDMLEENGEHAAHVPMSWYYMVFAALMVLLLITVGASLVNLGRLNAPIAVAIAFAKAILIVLVFMHAKFSSRLVQTFACTGLIFVGIMFLLTFNDYLTRSWFGSAY